jgi:prophage DNA circulation protein
MLAKEYLQRVDKLDIMINNKLAEQQQWLDMALSITANMGGERVQSSGSKSKMADAIDKCIDMESDINRLIDELIEAKRDVIRVIEAVDNPTEYDVLHKRYIQKMSLSDIAERYGKEYSWATTTHGRALQSVQRILDGTKTDNILEAEGV